MVRIKKLIFKQIYGEDILEGRKTSTIRLTSNLKKGDIVEIRAGMIKLGTAIIENVEVKEVKDLTDEDARVDGFKDRNELIKELKKIYGKRIDETTEVKLIRFKLIGRDQDKDS